MLELVFKNARDRGLMLRSERSLPGCKVDSCSWSFIFQSIIQNITYDVSGHGALVSHAAPVLHAPVASYAHAPVEVYVST